MDVNVRLVVRITQFAIPHLEKTQGAIVNVSSIVSSQFASQDTFYATSKAALDQLTIHMASTLILRGIRVNSVNPGAVYTNFAVSAGAPKEMVQGMYDKILAHPSKPIPRGRCGEPDEIGKIILFLADRTQSDIIVGQRIVADGGSVLKNSLFSVDLV